jgi:uncharacterized repeat protein (TIGR03803 family)
MLGAAMVQGPPWPSRFKRGLMPFHRKLFTVNAVLFMLPPFLFACHAWAADEGYKVLHTFTVGSGGYGVGSVISDAAGNLYGTTANGGYRGACCGTVFELVHRPDGSWKEELLYSFNQGDGSAPAGLVFDQAGNLYGTALDGGPNNLGVAFKLTHEKRGWTETVLYYFCSLKDCADGSVPDGLVIDAEGNLYGTTVLGGSSSACSLGCGTVFKLTPNPDGTWKERVLHSFGGSDGQTPYANLIFDQAGNLYGTTAYGGILTECAEGTTNGCGVVFQLTPDAGGRWTNTVLHAFCSISNCSDGMFPLDSLVFDQAGNLYGTAELGGAAGGGVVFELVPNMGGIWEEKVLHSFTGKDGAAPSANLIIDQTGNLYGTASEGGANDAGVVFRLTAGSWSLKVLHSFRDHPGALPFAGVIFGLDGNLYGTTYGDSNSTHGSAFQLTP